jgi:O-antigen/teichoic acid export membrane protein
MTAHDQRLSIDRFGVAAGWRFAYLLIQGGASVVLFSALAHILARDAFAAAAVAQGVLVIAQALGDFGLSQAAVTALPSRIAAEPAHKQALLAGAVRAFAYAGAIAVLLTIVAAPLVPGPAVVPVLVIAPAAGASVLVAGADGILRAQGEFRRPVLIVAASRTAAFAGVPVALVTRDAGWACAAISAGTLLGTIGAIRALRQAADPGGRPPATAGFVRATLPLGVSQLFVVLATRVDTILAGALSGLVAAATFEGAWRIYQIGQYAIGGIATAAAPFIADALGSGRAAELIGMIRRLMVRLVAGGVVVGAAMYLGRSPLAHLLAGSLAAPVARALPALAFLTPVAVAGLLGMYTIISFERHRRDVLVAYVAGGVVNVILAAALGHRLGGRGVVLACAIGLAVTNAILLIRFIALMRVFARPAAERTGVPPATAMPEPPR